MLFTIPVRLRSLFRWAQADQEGLKVAAILVLVGLGLIFDEVCDHLPRSVDPLLAQTMTFDFQPTLKGALVELRPLCADDEEGLFAVASDPLIWEQHPVRNRYQPAVFSAFFRESLASGAALTTVDCKDGRIIGSSRFNAYNEQANEVEIGWTFLARSHWGSKYNKEIKQLMLGHAFQFVKRVVFLISPHKELTKSD